LPDPPGQTWNRNALRLGGQQLDPIAESVLPLPEEELVDRDPFLRVNVLRAPRLVKPSLSADEMTKVLPVARTGRNRYRDEAVLLFILDTGARACEVCGPRADAINWSSGIAKLYCKGRKERYVPFCPHTAKAM
jgi:site-specific recombinase XerD